MKATTWFVCGAILCVACGGSPPPPADATAETPAPPRDEAAPAPPFMPETTSSWIRDGAVQRYGPGNLWEYINGGAEQYLAYGFEEVAAARYRHASGAIATLDVYRMTERVAAFGIYTEERSSKARPVQVGVEGHAGSDSLRFWSGEHYVKLSVAPSEQGPADALHELGHEVASRLGDPGPPPAELGYLPREGLVDGSIKYVPADVLGQSFLSKAFQAEYAAGGATATLLMLPTDSEGAAVGALKQYEAFLAGAGGTATPLAGIGHEAFSARDGFYGRVLAARKGQYLVIALGSPDEASARTLVSALLGRLPGAVDPTGQAGRP